MTGTIPPDTRAAGQTGHIGDHNNISEVLEDLQQTLQGILTGGLTTTGSVDITQAGQGISIAEGPNARQGTAVLSGGSAVVTNSVVTANSRIQLTGQSDGGTPGFVRVSARVPGVSFTITSSSPTDTSVIAYLISEPG